MKYPRGVGKVKTGRFSNPVSHDFRMSPTKRPQADDSFIKIIVACSGLACRGRGVVQSIHESRLFFHDLLGPNPAVMKNARFRQRAFELAAVGMTKALGVSCRTDPQPIAYGAN